jgi:hypothetical protein
MSNDLWKVLWVFVSAFVFLGVMVFGLILMIAVLVAPIGPGEDLGERMAAGGAILVANFPIFVLAMMESAIVATLILVLCALVYALESVNDSIKHGFEQLMEIMRKQQTDSDREK